MAKKPASKTCNTDCNSQSAIDAMQQIFKPFEFSKAPGVDQIKAQMEKFSPTVFGNYEDLSQSGKDNVEAVVKSTQILAKAAEELSKAINTFTQSSIEMNMHAGQALLGIKSLQDLVEVQSELARNSMDHFIAESSKISDMTVKVANEAMEPIQTRINITIEKLSGKAA